MLKAWDLHENLDSKGAVLFRRFVVAAAATRGAPPAGIWRTPFDANDPVNTPRDLNTDDPRVEAALRGAVDDVNGLGKGLDVTLREVQFEKRGEEKIPIHGGPGDPEGDFNAINVPWVPGEGYPNVPHGSSFVMAAHLDGSKCPDLRTILTYSQSTNPDSPYFADQTRMFSRKAVGRPGLLRARHPRRPGADDPAPRDRALHEPAGDHLPAAAAQAGADQARARDGQRQAREDPPGRAPRRARLAARAAEGALPDPRDREDVAQAHDQARPARAHVRAAAEGTAAVRRALLLAGALLAAGAAPASAQFDPAYEASNFSKTNERAAIHSTPEYKALLAQVSAANVDGGRADRGRRPGALVRRARRCAGATARAARATRGSTTGCRRTTGRSGPWCSPRATARRSAGACGSRARGRRSGPAS